MVQQHCFLDDLQGCCFRTFDLMLPSARHAERAPYPKVCLKFRQVKSHYIHELTSGLQ